nr:MAG TPA: hypothetical protein [Bacteriophage sp.]
MLAATSSGLAKSCHIGILSTAAHFSNVGYDGVLIC